MTIVIRPETEDDIAAIHDLNVAAFEQPGEAELVDALRKRQAVTLSWVAVDDGVVVGHILYSPATITSPDASFAALSLGPVGVLPSHQNRGIGGQLIRESLEALRAEGRAAVFVLGHASYYPKFGFVQAKGFGVACEFKVSDEVFMALELRPNGLLNKRGTLYYQPEFKNV